MSSIEKLAVSVESGGLTAEGAAGEAGLAGRVQASDDATGNFYCCRVQNQRVGSWMSCMHGCMHATQVTEQA